MITETLGYQIISGKKIEGINYEDSVFKIMQYADDTEIIVANNASIKEPFKMLERFEKAGRAYMNVSRTKGLRLGNWKKRQDKLLYCKWTNKLVNECG